MVSECDWYILVYHDEMCILLIKLVLYFLHIIYVSNQLTAIYLLVGVVSGTDACRSI